MWVHPDASEKNITTQFPEIFDKHDILYFGLPGRRMYDFYQSAEYLDASRAAKDIGKIFSAVQRASAGGRHVLLESYLRRTQALNDLAEAGTPDEVKKVISLLIVEYHARYGMRSQIHNFYVRHLDESGKQLLRTKLARPAAHRPRQSESEEGQLKVRIDFLLDRRNGDTHAATYFPLPVKEQIPLMYESKLGDRSSVWGISLTFDDLYEITRKAMVHLWLGEYEEYWKNGGKESIENSVARVLKDCEELNSRR